MKNNIGVWCKCVTSKILVLESVGSNPSTPTKITYGDDNNVATINREVGEWFSPLALGVRECWFESSLLDISGSDQGKMKKGYGALEASVW